MECARDGFCPATPAASLTAALAALIGGSASRDAGAGARAAAGVAVAAAVGGACAAAGAALAAAFTRRPLEAADARPATAGPSARPPPPALDAGGGGRRATGDPDAAAPPPTPPPAPRAPVTAPVPDGEAAFAWPDGAEYVGEWRAGAAHGRGVFAWPAGASYEGEWRAGLEDGVGTLRTPDGAAYCGYWRGGALDGDGVYRPAAPGSARAAVIFLRRYARGDLASETVLRVADYDVRRAARGDARARAAARKEAARARGAARAAARPGETIYKGHASYDLARALQMGVMFSAARSGAADGAAADGAPAPPAPLTPADFAARVEQAFPPCDAGGPAFKWKDYAPAAFAALRAAWGVDVPSYLVSLTGDRALRELASPGKSGSVFFLSDDDRCGVGGGGGRGVGARAARRARRRPAPPVLCPPQIPRQDRLPGGDAVPPRPRPGVHAARARVAPASGGPPRHPAHPVPGRAPGRALGRRGQGGRVGRRVGGGASASARARATRGPAVVAPPRANPPPPQVRFVVMGNVFPTDVALHRKYDVKGARGGGEGVGGGLGGAPLRAADPPAHLAGSTQGRTAGPAALATPGAVLKDLDVDVSLALPRPARNALLAALAADTALLERVGVIDYSLLLGVHYAGWGPGCWRPPGAARGTEAPTPGAPAPASRAATTDAGDEPASARAPASPRALRAPGTPGGGGGAAARAAGVALDDLIERAMAAPRAGAGGGGGAPALRPVDSWAKLRDAGGGGEEGGAGFGGARPRLAPVASGVELAAPPPPPPSLPPVRTGTVAASHAGRGSPRGVAPPGDGFAAAAAAAAAAPPLPPLRRLHSVGAAAALAHPPRLGVSTPAVALPDHPLCPRRESSFLAALRPGSARPATPAAPATLDLGEPVLLYFGVIDFLQGYNARKAAEHVVKSLAYGPAAMSVVNPRAYAARFMGAVERLFVEAEEGRGREGGVGGAGAAA